MSRITHCSSFPLTIDYWDYYILCGLNIEAARILQRLEFWDGTKGEENHEVASPTVPGIQLARFIWKSEEELSWELMGSCGEKRLAACLHFLIHDRQYVVSRSNPVRRFDRTKQYAVQVQRIQEHLNKLDALIKTLLEAGRRLRPVQFAIEALIRQGKALEELTVERIAAQLATLHDIMQEDDERRSATPQTDHRQRKAQLPTFIRLPLQKDEAQGFCASSPLGTMPVSMPQKGGMEVASVRNREQSLAVVESSKSAATIPENTSEKISKNFQTEQTHGAEARTGNHLHEAVAATPPSFALRKTNDAELCTLASDPQQHATKATTLRLVSTSKQAEIHDGSSPALDTAVMDVQQKNDEADTPNMTAEEIVSLFEQKHGSVYDEKARPYQLASAHALLALKLPLTAEIVGHIYDECCDGWWQEHYGTLHVSHLVERERSHGQLRIARLLHRVQAKAQRTIHATKQVSNNRVPMSSLPPGAAVHLPDVLHDCTITGSGTPYGWTGWASSSTHSEPVRLVQWHGAIVPLDDALNKGYNGGWERFRSGESDDLDALVRKYQEQGVLPQSTYAHEGANKHEQPVPALANHA